MYTHMCIYMHVQNTNGLNLDALLGDLFALCTIPCQHTQMNLSYGRSPAVSVDGCNFLPSSPGAPPTAHGDPYTAAGPSALVVQAPGDRGEFLLSAAFTTGDP